MMGIARGLIIGLPISIAIWILTFMGLAHSQDQQKPPLERALGIRIGNELNANLACSAENIGLHDQLSASQAEVKRLTEKYEPKKDESLKP